MTLDWFVPETLGFRQDDFARCRPFASFLPGLAGPGGIAMWAFYVNRGQGVAAFGVGTKDQPIMEFQPASRAWLETARTGFRTFVRVHRDGVTEVHEPFADPSDATTLTTGLAGLDLTCEGHGLRAEVSYTTACDEPFAGLIRRVRITNVGASEARLEIVDGLARLIPAGIDDLGLKTIGRTLEAWMRVVDTTATSAGFRLLASSGDSSEVTEVSATHFVQAPGVKALIVDPVVAFGPDTALGGVDFDRWDDWPTCTQITAGRTPCALAVREATLAPGESTEFVLLIAHSPDGQPLPTIDLDWAKRQQARASELVRTLTDPIAARTGRPIFDAYLRQTYLDNLLRGGEPLLLGDQVIHLYGRKHGDLERDYNAFALPTTPLPQGNANFRDLVQNRRSETWFHPEIGRTTSLDFLGLLTMDGRNPLVISGERFQTRTGAVSPGGAYDAEAADPLVTASEALVGAARELPASFTEGYWVDHWIYLLDLLDTHRAVFPDDYVALLDSPVGYWRCAATVPPSDTHFVLTDAGVRRYVHVAPDGGSDGWLVDEAGERVEASVFGKLLGLVAVKVASLDASGIGLDLDAGRPGWYDALNGLPALLGSSLGEVRELRRALRLLSDAAGSATSICLPAELARFCSGVRRTLRELAADEASDRDLRCWQAMAKLREELAAAGASGTTVRLSADEVAGLLTDLRARVDVAIERARRLPPGTMYLRHEVTGWVETGGHDERGRPYVTPTELVAHPLPAFLEAHVHELLDEPERAAEIDAAVHAGPLLDRELGMLRVNASLDGESHEIGRARAFPPGWLENESIWLHMEYKYLLALLRTGRPAEFWAAFERQGVCFQAPERYGRSPLENSSFLVSSAHPDPTLHGGGYVARLSGATAELLSMWTLALAGPAPFRLVDGQLALTLRPALPGWLFDADGRLEATLLGHAKLVIENPGRVDTWTLTPRRIEVEFGTSVVRVDGPDVVGELADRVRGGGASLVRVVHA